MDRPRLTEIQDYKARARSWNSSSTETLAISPHISVSTRVNVTYTLHQGPSSSMDSGTQASGRTSVLQLRNVARGCFPSSGDTVLMSQQSTCSDNHVNSAPVAPSRPASPRVGAGTTSSQSRKKRGHGRDLVDEDHLSRLVAAYNLHFEKYSEGKVNVTQLIPSLVWKNTYATYLQAFPDSTFKQESLKERLRDTLKELKTGNNNDGMSERAALQSRTVMEALRCTCGHAKRNILRKRAKILQATQAALKSDDDTSADSDCVRLCSPPCTAKKPSAEFLSPPCTGKKPNADFLSEKGKNTQEDPKGVLGKKHDDPCKENRSGNQPLTKTQMLHKQISSIERISNTYVNSSAKRDALVDMRIVANEYKHNKNWIEKLKTAYEFGVISEPEFKVSVDRQVDMWSVLQDDILDEALNYYVLPGEQPGPRYCEEIKYDELDEYMKQWRALLNPVVE